MVNHTWKFGTFKLFIWSNLFKSMVCEKWMKSYHFILSHSLVWESGWESFFLRINVSVEDEKGCSVLVWSCLPFARSFSVFISFCVPVGAGVNLTQIWPSLTFTLQTEEFLFSLFHLLTSLQVLEALFILNYCLWHSTSLPVYNSVASPLGCPLLDLQLLPVLLSLPFPFSFLLPCLLLTYLLSCSFILFFCCCLETALHCCPGWSGNTVLTWPFHLCLLSEFVSVPCNRNWLNWLGWALIPGSSNLPAAACFASFVL